MLDKQDKLTLMELACLLEDAIDMHDRHWKIHWMLNFAQLSATLNLRAVMEKTHGKIDEALLGRLQNSAKDRNWDSIEALWKMKEEAKADSTLAAAFKHETAGEIIAALKGTERGRKFIEERVVPYQKEFGWHAVWSHEFVFPTVYEHMEPVIELVRGYIETNYDYRRRSRFCPMTSRRLPRRSWRASRVRRSRRCGWPTTSTSRWPAHAGPSLLHRPGCQRARPVGAHRDRQEARRAGRSGCPRRCGLPALQRVAVFMGDPKAMDARALVAKAKAAREQAYTLRPKDWIGTVTQSQLDFPYLNLWGFPEKFYRKADTVTGQFTGLGGSPGVVEGVARVFSARTSSMRSAAAISLSAK